MNPVFQEIAQRYLASRAGRTGAGQRDLVFPFNDLLRKAGCLHGPARHEAIRELENLQTEELLVLERHARDPSAILRVRLPLGKAEAFIKRFGQTGPESQRRSFAEMLLARSETGAPPTFLREWRLFCKRSADEALCGRSIAPLDSSDISLSAELLEVTAKLLAWEGESYLRFASCVVCGDSKRLGQLQPRIERLLDQITGNKIRTLADLGITETGGGCWVHGPGILISNRGEIDLAALNLPAHFSKSDLTSSRLESSAKRWVTVENETMLLELAKLHTGVMLLSSGFRGGVANSTVVTLLRSTSEDTELWHFGDSDPKGFDILRDLRERTGKNIKSLHMLHRPCCDSAALSVEDHKIIQRLLISSVMTAEEKAEIQTMLNAGTKGYFEQESLGRPSPAWPFY